MELELKIRFWNCNLELEFGIWIWNWKLECAIGIWNCNWNLEFGIEIWNLEIMETRNCGKCKLLANEKVNVFIYQCPMRSNLGIGDNFLSFFLQI